MPGNVGFDSAATAERVLRATRRVEELSASLGRFAPRAGDIMSGLVRVTAAYDANYAEGVVAWWDPDAAAYTDGGDILVRLADSTAPAVGVQDGGWFSGVHPATGKGVYTIGRSGGDSLFFVKVTGSQVGTSGFWPCVLTVGSAAGTYTDDGTAAVFLPLTGSAAVSGNRYGPVKNVGVNAGGVSGIDGKTVYVGLGEPLGQCVDLEMGCTADGPTIAPATIRTLNTACP